MLVVPRYCVLPTVLYNHDAPLKLNVFLFRTCSCVCSVSNAEFFPNILALKELNVRKRKPFISEYGNLDKIEYMCLVKNYFYS